MKRYRQSAGEFTLNNSTAENANFLSIGGRDAGKKKICRVFCGRSHFSLPRRKMRPKGSYFL